MVKTYVATTEDVQNVQTQVNTLESTVSAPSTGLSDKVTANTNSITSLGATIGADDTSGLRKRITDNENAIGDTNSGITKQVTDLESTVGTDNTSGLQKRVVDLESKESVVDASVFTYDGASNTLYPNTSNQVTLGTETNYYLGGYYQFINFYGPSGTNEGTVDADNGSLGLYGETELALGYGNNNKDLIFVSTGIKAYRDISFVGGKGALFLDDTDANPEGVLLKSVTNVLGFYGINQGVVDTVPMLELTYDNKIRGNLPISRSGFHTMLDGTSGNSWQTGIIPGLLDDNIKLAAGSSGIGFGLNSDTGSPEITAIYCDMRGNAYPVKNIITGTGAVYDDMVTTASTGAAKIFVYISTLPDVHWEIDVVNHTVTGSNADMFYSWKRVIKT